MTIYYKAFDRNLRCRGYQYTEGEIHEIDGGLVLCDNGLHFCKDLVLTLEYRPVDNITDNKYAEVEPLGDIVWEEPTRHKGCTNKLRIVRVLGDDEVAALVDNKNNSGHRNSGHQNSGHQNSGDRNSGDWNSGDWNSGDWNSGHRNSGGRNSGHRNSGDWNSGHQNSGDRNSGDWNSGDWNSGHRNSGGRNSGDWNSGRWNSGDRNSGDWNSGDWNSGNYHTGAFNEGEAPFLAFNQPCDRKEWDAAYKPDFLYFTPGDDYKKSFLESWNNADPEDRMRVMDLPNFDADVFYRISGIDLREKE